MDILLFLSLLFAYSTATFFLFLLLYPLYFQLVERLNIRQEIREESSDGWKSPLYRALHLKKSGTPTGGGVLIWGSVFLVVLLSRFLALLGIVEQSLFQRGEVYIPLFTLLVMGFLGGVDDYWNARGLGKKKGIEAGPKMIFLIGFSLLAAIWFYFKLGYTGITIPGFGFFDIGLFFIPLSVFVIVGTANAVNITDGLDGLAGGLLIASFATFGAIAFFRGHFFLALFCGILCAALFAFLWFNVPPARFFMGDTGSLALGATLGVIAMMIDAMFILPIVGFVFVIETLSVIIQLTSKKWRGKKVFLIAPLHHHFEQKGWTESQIVMRFWIIGGAAAILGLIVGLMGAQTQI